jgi:hypothetical protein
MAESNKYRLLIVRVSTQMRDAIEAQKADSLGLATADIVRMCLDKGLDSEFWPRSTASAFGQPEPDDGDRDHQMQVRVPVAMWEAIYDQAVASETSMATEVIRALGATLDRRYWFTQPSAA